MSVEQISGPTHRRWRPCAALQPFVAEYSWREDRLGSAVTYVPLPARSSCFLQFFLEDRYRVVDVASGETRFAPGFVLVGPHTRRREDLLHSGTLRVFTIRLRPAGFRAIFGVPAREITSRAEHARDVLGKPLMELEEQLANAGSPERCASLAEQCLLRELRRRPPTPESLVAGRMAKLLGGHHGAVEISKVAARFDLSTRQVERAFQEHIGMSPKMYARLERLNFALRLSQQVRSAGGWADVADEAGYFDQSHMVRDFRALTGETPAGFRALYRPVVPSQTPTPA